MNTESTSSWFTLEELIQQLNQSLVTANQHMQEADTETPFHVQEFVVDLYLRPRLQEKTSSDKKVFFSFPHGNTEASENIASLSKISIRLKPTLVITHENV